MAKQKRPLTPQKSVADPESPSSPARSWFYRKTRITPSFLILGAMRCGTTSLYRYLCEHPRIVSATRKEVHFFDHNYLSGWEWYVRHFVSRFEKLPDKAHPLRRLTGEASPSYMLNPLAAQRASRHLPNAKIIAILRNPVDRAASHYQHGLRRKYEPLSFAEALDREQERIQGEREKLLREEVQRSDALQNFSYCTRGHYMEQIGEWLKYYPRHHLHIVLSEEFYADPARELERVSDFLGLETVKPRMPEEFEKFNFCEYDALGGALRERLIEHFRPHNAKLAGLIGRDPGWDC